MTYQYKIKGVEVKARERAVQLQEALDCFSREGWEVFHVEAPVMYGVTGNAPSEYRLFFLRRQVESNLLTEG